MPIYEYECSCCSFRFERKQSFSENTQAVCPRCQCGAQRIFSPVPIIFKGSGFYVTDSREKRDRPSEKSDTNQTEAGTEKGN